MSFDFISVHVKWNKKLAWVPSSLTQNICDAVSLWAWASCDETNSNRLDIVKSIKLTQNLSKSKNSSSRTSLSFHYLLLLTAERNWDFQNKLCCRNFSNDFNATSFCSYFHAKNWKSESFVILPFHLIMLL